MRCLQRDRAARFGDVAELADAIAPFAPDGEPNAARVRSVLRATRPHSSSWLLPSGTPAPSDGRLTASVDTLDGKSPLALDVGGRGDIREARDDGRRPSAPTAKGRRPVPGAGAVSIVLATGVLGAVAWRALHEQAPPRATASSAAPAGTSIVVETPAVPDAAAAAPPLPPQPASTPAPSAQPAPSAPRPRSPRPPASSAAAPVDSTHDDPSDMRLK
jgi:hypothetical protein